ncbi:(Fe-S)-binding protein [Sporomusa termitida]|uniref:Lactate utilization protein A n=1 Tax=Sporomusa termitida TaxID=2377 RepID=A0A517DWG5_9FIRM|nr:(Fe-S)-binding protein [Sporomusa termitida]QDR81673.1 Lactate utilization protein A [Sporomusa termitida]
MDMLAKDCVECGKCTALCQFLAQTGESPARIAGRGASVTEAFSCSLCGACEAVCPLGLSPRQLFACRREEAVRQGEFDSNEYRYLFPDRPNNVMNMYRRCYGVDYGDIENAGSGGTWFFPGCTLLTYSPGLTRAVFYRLQADVDCRGFWTACCGKPLRQLGLRPRAEALQGQLQEFLQQHNITRVITACPGCYYELEPVFQACNVSVRTVYEMLKLAPTDRNSKIKCTVHDACPDRFARRFGRQVRQALAQAGFSLREMQHSGAQAICCGSGGQLSHFRPDLTEQLVQARLAEARQSGADILIGYCLSCVLKLEGKAAMPVTHALNVLLAISEDFKGAKARAGQMLAGAAGERLWAEMMAE